MTDWDFFAYDAVARAVVATADAPPRPPSLAERLASAPAGDRARLLTDALAAGEPIVLCGADLRGMVLRAGRPCRRVGRDGPDVLPSRVVLDGAVLTGALLSGASLTGVSLRGADLADAMLVGADLSGADLTGANLRGANLTGATLSRADLSYADLGGAALLTANLANANLLGADLREALVQSTAMTRVCLRSADLRWARLTAANLRGADLRGARFTGTILNLANLAGAQVSASTELGLAFLYQARLERTALTRRHLVGGVGEAHTDLAHARDTYRALAHVFESGGNAADARWAHRQASRMDTASHRPDRAARYHLGGVSDAATAGVPAARSVSRARMALFRLGHGVRWLGGIVVDLASGYGTCGTRLLASLLTAWLAFAVYFHVAGAVIRHDGPATGWADALRYSLASLTPIDAYPYVATSDGARWMSTLEGVVGMLLLGALGFVASARLRRE